MNRVSSRAELSRFHHRRHARYGHPGSLKRILPILVLLLANTGAWARVPHALQANVPEDGPWVVRAYFSDPEMVREVASWNEPWIVDRENGFLVMEVDAEGYRQLLDAGFLVEIDDELTAEYHRENQYLEGQTSGIPGFPCYLTVEETFAFAQDLAVNFPGLATWTDIGDSWEKTDNPNNGFDMQVLKLTNANIAGEKPKLFIMSAVHAREYSTAGLNARFAEYLIDGYGQDADATWLLDYHEIHLMLQANPDGRIRAETGLLWRKNADNDFCTGTSNRGIDLNRNFEFMWGCCGGSSGSECSLTFRGPSPGSEPETAAIMDYVRSIFPDQRGNNVNDPAPVDATGVFLDLHSFGQCVLWPYGFDSTPTPNGTAIQTLGRKFAFFNGYFPEKASVSFDTDGTTDDFAYGDLGIAAYTFELGTTFFQSCASFESTILPDNLEALIYAAKVARTPYLTPAGPDVVDISLSDAFVEAGDMVTLQATANDSRYFQGNGAEPVQNIAAAEYTVDIPPWEAGAVPLPLAPLDGTFDNPQETITAQIDTAPLELGQHILFLRARDSLGNWGAVSAIFLSVELSFSELIAMWPDPITVLDLVPQVPLPPVMANAQSPPVVLPSLTAAERAEPRTF